MKKLIVFIVSLFLLIGCSDTFRCELKYNLVYPDTTYVRHYTFLGNAQATWQVYDCGERGKTLVVNPYGLPAAWDRTIARVPIANGNIDIVDFKVFRFGTDVPYPENNNLN